MNETLQRDTGVPPVPEVTTKRITVCLAFDRRPHGRDARFTSYSSGTVVDVHPLRLRRPDVIGARSDDAVIGALLEHVGAPPTDARAGEDRREQVGRDAEEPVRRGVEEV